MAVIPGFLAVGPFNTAVSALVPGNLALHAVDMNLLETGVFTQAPLLGVVSNNAPIDIVHGAVVGLITQTSHYPIFYDHIHILPALLELGNVLSTQFRTVEVYNAFATPSDVTSLLGLNSDGISVTEPFPTPYAIPPYSSVLYEFSISVDGPATVSAIFRWTIEGGEYDLTLTGQRVMVFPYQPDWQQGLVETLKWLTSVMVYHDGGEKRVSLRQRPRLSLEIGYLLWKESLTGAKNFIQAWQDRSMAVPLWQDQRKLTAAVAAGSSTLPLDPTRAGFYEGYPVVVYLNPNRFETVQVAAVAADSLTLSAPALQSWPAGALVIPLVFAKLRASVSLAEDNEALARFRLNWEADADRTQPWLPVAAAPFTLDTYERLQADTNWRDGLPVATEYEASILDYQTGAVNATGGREFYRARKGFKWTQIGRAKAETFRQFMTRRAGRRVPFFASTLRRDFEPLTAIANGSSSLLVRHTFDPLTVRGLVTHRHIEILLAGGARLIRTIDNISDNGDGTASLVVGSQFTASYPLTSILRISYLQLSRLADDEVSIRWLNPEIAETDVSYIEVSE